MPRYINIYIYMSNSNNDTNNSFDIQVINLKSRPERWEHFREVCPFLNYNRFNAVDGRNLHDEGPIVKIKLRPIEGQMRVLGEIGCKLSHYMLWRYVREQNKAVLILEDDVMFHDESVTVLNTAYQQLCSDKFKKMEWTLAFVGGQWTPKYGIGSEAKFSFQRSERGSRWYTKVSGSDNLYIRNKGVGGGWRTPIYRTTGGYFISPKGADMLIRIADRDPRFFNTPIDWWLLVIENRGLGGCFLDIFPHSNYQAPYNIGDINDPNYQEIPEESPDKYWLTNDIIRDKKEKIML